MEFDSAFASLASESPLRVAQESSVTVTDLNLGVFLRASFSSATILSCDCSDAAEADAEADLLDAAAEADAEADLLADDADWLLHPAIIHAASAATSAAETHRAIRFIRSPFPFYSDSILSRSLIAAHVLA